MEGSAQWLEEIGRIAVDGGMRIAYHPHVGTGVMTFEDVDRLMTDTDPDLVTLLYDTGHLHYAGVDPQAIVDKYARRIIHCHLKDIRQDVLDESLRLGRSFLDSVVAGVFTVPGDGVLNFPSYLEVLARNGFRGWLVVEAEQDPSRANPLEYAAKRRLPARSPACDDLDGAAMTINTIGSTPEVAWHVTARVTRWRGVRMVGGTASFFNCGRNMLNECRSSGRHSAYGLRRQIKGAGWRCGSAFHLVDRETDGPGKFLPGLFLLDLPDKDLPVELRKPAHRLVEVDAQATRSPSATDALSTSWEPSGRETSGGSTLRWRAPGRSVALSASKCTEPGLTSTLRLFRRRSRTTPIAWKTSFLT